MRIGFRIWMTVVAVLIVLLAVLAVVIYTVPVARERLQGYALDRLTARAAATADDIGESRGREVGRALEVAAATGQREALFVDRSGRVVESKGLRLVGDNTQILREAAAGGRMFETVGELNVAVTPVFYGGEFAGGVVLASRETEGILAVFYRSALEAALIASMLGGALVLLLASRLSARVERLASGARSIERGELTHRIEPGFRDELGELAKSFNTMAARLKSSFEQLEAERSTLDTLLGHLSDAVFATDSRGHLVFANPAARAMMNIGAEELPEKPPGLWADFDLQRAVTRCAREHECIQARVDSGQIPLRVNLEPLPDFDSGRGGVLVVMEDLSAGRRLEANQQRFLANAAHELKTPLTAILGAAEILSEESDDPQTRSTFVKHILKEARRMQQLSETMLSLARVGTDLREPNLETVELKRLARGVAAALEPLAHKAELAISVEGEGGRVRADREWLEQALLVVVSNAIKYSEPGGNVRLRVEGGTVAVEDEGVGMSAEDIPHVFERFYSGSGESGGFGLGLPICKELVERMGGTISIESEDGVGTTVKIELQEAGDGGESTHS